MKKAPSTTNVVVLVPRTTKVVVLALSTTKVVVLVAELEVWILSLAGAGQQERGRGVSVDCGVRGGREGGERERARERQRQRQRERDRERERERERDLSFFQNSARDMLHGMCNLYSVSVCLCVCDT